MDHTWIIVANHEVAQIFERVNFRSPVKLIHHLEEPAGRLKPREINSDRSGSHEGPSRGRGGFSATTPNRHGFSPKNDVEEQEELDFARQIAAYLREGRNKKLFQGLVLVADPHMLGAIRYALDKPTGDMILLTESKNRAGQSPQEVGSYVQDLMQAIDSKTPFMRKAG